MEPQIKYGTGRTPIARKKNYFYPLMNLSLAVILPALSVLWDYFHEHEPIGWELIGKWFIFYAVGIRLFTAGVSQASNPAYTGRIFKMRTQESFVVIRELGFANIALGVMGVLSVLNNNWRILAAIAGGLYLGLAGLQHLFKKPETQNELIALLYDLFVLIVIGFYLTITLFF